MMDFDLPEYETRTERAQEAMSRQGIGALFLTSEPEVRYFTGFRTQFWQSPTRPWFAIVPAIGKPIAVIPEIGAPLMQKTWLDDIHTWPSPDQHDDGISILESVLADYAKVGVLMGRESQLRMPVSDFQKLRLTLAKTQFVDATPLISALRFVKSEAEIAIISEICGHAQRAFDRIPEILEEGLTLKEVFRRFKIELLMQGAEEVPYLAGGAGPLGYDDVISPPGNRPLLSGDILMLDTGASLKGYFCDFDRNFAVGEPSQEVRNAHEILWQATEAGLAAARPGATCAQIFTAMLGVIGSAEGNVGRFGHGLGMQLTEFPSLIDWDQTVMQEGAVMTLEPSMRVEGGDVLVHEENIVIRDGPPQLLSRRTDMEITRITPTLQ